MHEEYAECVWVADPSYLMIELVLAILVIVGMWKLFAKAGRPGWASIIPIYNMVVLLQIAGMSGWWLLAMFIPLVNIVVSIVMYAGIAKNFGRGAGTTLGLIFLPMIFFMILGFGSAEYQPRQ